MQRLIILTDLWGKESSSHWLDEYIQFLENKFECVVYDSCELAGIDPTGMSENEIHNQFVNGGIERAIKNIVDIETNLIDVLGFSVGGTIAWKAALSGLKVNKLTALSSTRIRYETNKPDCTISLHFGENDSFKPNEDWLRNLGLQIETVQNEGHDFYRNFKLVESIIKRNHFAK